MSSFTSTNANLWIDHLLRNSAKSSPATVYLAAHTADPTETGTTGEVSGGSYARTAIAFSAPSSGSTSNSGTVTFPTASADWGTITHFSIHTASSGGTALYYGSLSSSRVISSGGTLAFAAGSVTVTMSAGISTYLGNAIINHDLRNTSHTPVATVYIGLHTANPTAAGTVGEVSGGSYARDAVASGFSAGASSTTDNDAAIEFAQATADWGTVTHCSVWDASTSGNMYFYAALSASQVVQDDGYFTFAAGAFDITLN